MSLPKLDLKTLEEIEFLLEPVRLSTPAGHEYYDLKANEVEDYLERGDEFIVEALGYDVDLFAEYIDAVGFPRCMGTTVKGKPCNSPITGYSFMSFSKWIEVHRKDYCSKHGGMNVAEVAAARKAGKRRYWSGLDL